MSSSSVPAMPAVKRHMFQRGGIEDHVGAVFLEDGLQVDAVADAQFLRLGHDVVALARAAVIQGVALEDQMVMARRMGGKRDSDVLASRIAAFFHAAEDAKQGAA